MVPEQMMKGKSHAWSNNIFRHYKEVGKSMLEGPSHVQVDMVCFNISCRP